jgi:hypothetical protein
MCHFTTSNDVYTDCLLWEKAHEDASEGKPDENATNHFNLMRLLRILPNSTRTANVPEAGPSAAGVNSPVAPLEEELAVHVIKQKTYFQCDKARNNPDLSEVHIDKRYCSNAAKTKMEEGDLPKEERSSRVRGIPCPVCEAARKAIEEHLDSTDVVGTL